MNNIEIDGIVRLSDGKNYSVTAIFEDGDKKYAFLATLSDPLEVAFIDITNGADAIRELESLEEKQRALAALSQSIKKGN
jgi:hypothetical protein